MTSRSLRADPYKADRSRLTSHVLFALGILLALAAFFAGVAYSFADQEPRRGGLMLLLQTKR